MPNNSEGARLYGGRWNEMRTAVIYCSASPSLAALEVLVHFQMIPADYRVVHIDIPGNVEIESIDATSLAADWFDESSIPQTAAIGTRWANSLSSAVMRVPSAVIRSEHNYILNPHLGKFGAIRFEMAAVDELDQRLRETK